MTQNRIGLVNNWPGEQNIQMENDLQQIVDLLNSPSLFVDNDDHLERAKNKLNERRRALPSYGLAKRLYQTIPQVLKLFVIIKV